MGGFSTISITGVKTDFQTKCLDCNLDEWELVQEEDKVSLVLRVPGYRGESPDHQEAIVNGTFDGVIYIHQILSFPNSREKYRVEFDVALINGNIVQGICTSFSDGDNRTVVMVGTFPNMPATDALHAKLAEADDAYYSSVKYAMLLSRNSVEYPTLLDFIKAVSQARFGSDYILTYEG